MRILAVSDHDRGVSQRGADTLRLEAKQGCMDGLARQMLELVREGKWNEQLGFAILHGS
jgi:hypothetical protein